MKLLFDSHCQNFTTKLLYQLQPNSLSLASIPRERSEWAQCYSRGEKGRQLAIEL